MTDTCCPPPADADRVLLPVFAAAAAEIGDEINRLSTTQSRPALVRTLRMGAGDLGRSLVAEDQLRRLAYEAAADDLSWGRPPLVEWLARMREPVAERSRAALRARTPEVTPTTQSAARRLAREIRRRGLDEAADVLRAARSLPDHLREAGARQLACSDDPRLSLLPVQRAIMRTSADVLQQEADWLEAPLSFTTLGSFGASWWRGVRDGVLPERGGW